MAASTGCADEPGDDQTTMSVAEIEGIPLTPTNSLPTTTVNAPDEGCTLEARPAVLVNVFAGLGSTVREAPADTEVFYRHFSPESGWSDILEAECINDECTTASLGFGQPGEYVVGAFSCGEGRLARVYAGETADGCHVETQHLPIVLDELAPACWTSDDALTLASEASESATIPSATPEALLPDAECPIEFPNPAVVVTTTLRQGDLLIPWTPREIDSRHQTEREFTEMACIDPECTSYVAGWGRSGEFDIQANICGQFVTERVEVSPSLDGCNVETEWLYLAADAASCVEVGLE